MEVNLWVVDYMLLIYVCWFGNIDIVKVLLVKGVSVNLENIIWLILDWLDEDLEMFEIILFMILRDIDNFNFSNIKGMFIDVVCCKKNMVVVKELLKYGVKVLCIKLLLLVCDCVDEVMFDVV